MSGRGAPRLVFLTMEMPKMPQGSLRRFPVGGVILAFLAGLLLAGLLILLGIEWVTYHRRITV